MLTIRPELAGDADAIKAVQTAAFPTPAEASLVDALRGSDAWIGALSLVALREGGVVGHVLGSRITAGNHGAVGLAPLAVRPEYQGRGIGGALVAALISAAQARDEPLIVLLGEPGYYARFGFQTAARFGIEPPDPAWRRHFQVLPLAAYSSEIRGTVTYPAPFSSV